MTVKVRLDSPAGSIIFYAYRLMSGDKAMRRVVIGIDESEESLRGASWVAEWTDSSAIIWLTYAMGPEPELTRPLRDNYEGVAYLTMQGRLRPAQNLLSERGFTEVYEELRYGTAVDVLLAVAADNQASAIVVGSSGRGRLASLLLGSVAQSIIAQPNFTVIVVH